LDVRPRSPSQSRGIALTEKMTTTVTTTSNANQRSRLMKALRIAFTSLVVASACYVSYGFGRLWHEWRSIPHVDDSSQALADFEPLLATPSLAGHWAFADLDWALQSRDVGPSELKTEFDAAASSTSAVYSTPEISQKLDELVRSLHVQPRQLSDNRVYVLEKPDFRAQLVLRDRAGHTDLISLHAAFHKTPEQWQVLEFTPRDKNDPAADSSHLLPLPPAARRAAGRFDDDGRLLLEFVELKSDVNTLLTNWKQNGWEVRQSELINRGGFNYLCGRGETIIYAWSADPPTAIQNLMLVRSPARAKQTESQSIN
jgi:hypothetical protein